METLSDQRTLLWKFLYPAISIVAFAVVVVVATTAAAPGEPWLASLLGITVWGAWWTWLCLRWKRVRLDGSDLLVSDYRREIRVPLRAVAAVRRRLLIGALQEPAEITFESPTAFGLSVEFVPPVRLWPLHRSEHQVIRRLRDLAAAARDGSA